ncbi:LysR family transcriptional regulator [Kitasatospora sp. MBT63]|uniref:LysR family transcriptional regulator n=1 Tax=Kitasatospora sp. MBT63 TaxID=1444768 RepID=UPI00068C06FD|nr:LysR family transcriptional regulator [Kitasatospora sp. MBT63]
MEIDPRRLRVLHAVAVRGGVMEGARLLHLTPSAVSQQIAQLERETGVKLLDRTHRRVELTAAGRLLAARAERIERELADARRELAALSGRAVGRVVVAAFPTAVRHLVVPAIGRLAVDHPDIELSVVDTEGQAALRELRTGAVDVVIAEQDAALASASASASAAAPAGTGDRERRTGIAVRTVLEDEYRIVVPPGWAARIRTVADLAAVPWIAAPPESACGQALARLAAEHALTPRRAHVCMEFPAVLALVEAGLGAAVVPLLALAGVPQGRVAAAALPGVGHRVVSVHHRAGAAGPEPVVAAVVGALVDAAAAAAGAGAGDAGG